MKRPPHIEEPHQWSGPPEQLALIMRHGAVAYYIAAGQVRTDTRALEPKYFLYSHCLEIGLKSFLVLKGWTEARCRTHLGHNLVKARDEAISAGLSISEFNSTTIDSMSREHDRPFSFRYFNPGGWAAPSMENVRACCFDVLTEAQVALFDANGITLTTEHDYLLR